MPAKVRVRIWSARNLPIMNKAGETTDAFVELKLGQETDKTDVCWKSVDPEFNTDWFRFEVSDQILFEEALQLRVMDHDTYSSHDAIGKVTLMLSNYLDASSGDSIHQHYVKQWFPVYDTMHGLRGELQVELLIIPFGEPARPSVLLCSDYPHERRVRRLFGFVDAAVLCDDPEYQWLDRIRTPRTTNEARQILFSRMSGAVRRKVSRQARNLGANAIIGYHQHLDVFKSIVVMRVVGTAALLDFATEQPSTTGTAMRSASHTKVKSVAFHVDDDALVGSVDDSPKSDSNMRTASCEFPFITTRKLPLPCLRYVGGIVSTRIVKPFGELEHMNIHGGDYHDLPDSWFRDARQEVKSHMIASQCNALLGYDEQVYPVPGEDICILTARATAVLLAFEVTVPSCRNTIELFTHSAPTFYSKRYELHESEGVLPAPTASLPGAPLTSSSSASKWRVGTTDTASSADRIDTSKLFARPSDSAIPGIVLTSIEIFSASSDSRRIASRGNIVQSRVVRSFGKLDPKASRGATAAQQPPRAGPLGVARLRHPSLSTPLKGKKSGASGGIGGVGDAGGHDGVDAGVSDKRRLTELLSFIDYELYSQLTAKMKLLGFNCLFGLTESLWIGKHRVIAVASGTAYVVAGLPRDIKSSVYSLGQGVDHAADVEQQVSTVIERSQELLGIRTVAAGEEGAAQRPDPTTKRVRWPSSGSRATSSDDDPHGVKAPTLLRLELDDVADAHMHLAHLLEPMVHGDITLSTCEYLLQRQQSVAPRGFTTKPIANVSSSQLPAEPPVTGTKEKRPQAIPQSTSALPMMKRAGWLMPGEPFCRILLLRPDSLNAALRELIEYAEAMAFLARRRRDRAHRLSVGTERGSSVAFLGLEFSLDSVEEAGSIGDLVLVVVQGTMFRSLNSRFGSQLQFLRGAVRSPLSVAATPSSAVTSSRSDCSAAVGIGSPDSAIISTTESHASDTGSTGPATTPRRTSRAAGPRSQSRDMQALVNPSTVKASAEAAESIIVETAGAAASAAPAASVSLGGTPLGSGANSPLKVSTLALHQTTGGGSTSALAQPMPMLSFSFDDYPPPVYITSLSYAPPPARVTSYVGLLNFYTIREETSLKESDFVDLGQFLHGCLVELMAMMRARVRAQGGNAVLSFTVRQLQVMRVERPQVLAHLSGDVVRIVDT